MHFAKLRGCAPIAVSTACNRFAFGGASRTRASLCSLQSRHPLRQSAAAGFHTSPLSSKKGGKQGKSHDHQNATAVASIEDPFALTELEQAIANAHARLKEDLSKLRGGGRFNPEVIDNLRVKLDKAGRESVRLGDLAQCIPKGRVVNIIVGDKEHIKPISSAIQSSNLSLNPQPDAQNPLQLNVALPPPTTEARQQTVKEADKLSEIANTAIKNARAVHHKKLRSMQLGRQARPDDLRKANERMEKVTAQGGEEVKKLLQSAKKVLEG